MRNDRSTWRQLASLLDSPLTLADVGARAGIADAWSDFAPDVRVFGFEPDAEECARLNAAADPIAEYVPSALWSTAGEVPFYVTEDPMCSSVYRPSDEMARERPRLAQTHTRLRTTITVLTLDEWAHQRGVARLDYLKLDAQGGELAILEGAERVLPSVRAIKVELSFTPQYEGAPFFADVDGHLRERGFALWRLSELSHCGLAGTGNPAIPEHIDYNDQRVHLVGGGGQLLWCDGYYVRGEASRLAPEIDWQDALRDACLACAHGYVDLAEASVRRAMTNAPAGAHDVLAAVLDSSVESESVPPEQT